MLDCQRLRFRLKHQQLSQTKCPTDYSPAYHEYFVLYFPIEMAGLLNSGNQINLQAHVSFVLADTPGHPPIQTDSQVLVCDGPITSGYLALDCFVWMTHRGASVTRVAAPIGYRSI